MKVVITMMSHKVKELDPYNLPHITAQEFANLQVGTVHDLHPKALNFLVRGKYISYTKYFKGIFVGGREL